VSSADEQPADPSEALLEAVIGIGADLGLRGVLERLVVAACRLSGARYGALGVIGPDDMLAEFVTHGLTEEERARIGSLPRGHGILGLLVKNPDPLRLDRISDHPDSYGFPPNHPPMTTFLGVPVRAGDQVFGNLYLTEKAGGSAFTDGDERVVTGLAAAAGVVIEHSRLYILSERRRRWLESTGQMAESVRAAPDLDMALEEVLRCARIAFESDLAFMVTNRPGAGWQIGPVDGGTIEDAHELVEELSDEVGRALYGARGAEADSASGPVVLSRFSPDPGGRGALILLRRGTTLVPDDPQFFAGYADHATLALGERQAQADRDVLNLFADRDRIARDLHDLVIQRLFAAGLQLQGASRSASRPDVRERIDNVVAELDATIRDIRATIFELHRRPGQSSLRSDMRRLVDEYADILGFAPLLRVSGPIDTAVTEQVQVQMFAVLREALSNVARHARAAQVSVDISVRDGEISCVVADNGVGVSPDSRQSGLANLRSRAEELGGSLILDRRSPQGTRLEWHVPI
jgi:signal transduction histidine kinase